mgnify:FL=1
MKKALITGASGFVGSHLAEYLVAQNISVTGFAHPRHPIDNLKDVKNKINIIKIDILNKSLLEKYLEKENFDFIFHLAAFSSPSQSFKNPKETLENNIIGQLYLLESLAKNKSKSKVLIIGSADEYGEVKEEKLPINEETNFAPASPYAVSKVAQDMLGLQFFLHHKLHIVRVRSFNHIGPRQSKAFVVPAFASQIAELEKTNGGKIKVGNLNSWRDFTDVRDIVRAYLLALQKGIPGEVYNIGSGKLFKIEEILKILLSFSKAKIEVIKDKSRIRLTEIQKSSCDFTKFKKQTGWEPIIPIAKTLSDTIEFERNKLII